MFIYAAVTLSQCVGTSIEELVCIRSDAPLSRGGCNCAKATFCLCLFCFLSQVASWTHLRMFDSPRVSSVARANEWWRLWPIVTSLVLNFCLAAGSISGSRSVGYNKGVSEVFAWSPLWC